MELIIKVMIIKHKKITLDKALEEELANPRVLAWSVIIKDGQPVYNNNIFKTDTNRDTTTLLNNLSKPTFELRSPDHKNSSSFYPPNNVPEIFVNREMGMKGDQCSSSCDKHGPESEGNCKVIKKDFSIWRCLYRPEIALNPRYSGGYGNLRLALCLNKITSALEKSLSHGLVGGASSDKKECIELLPYIRIYYDNELLFQSCIVNKNACIITEIEVHHPLSNIIIEVLDFDDSDPSLIGSSDDLIGHIILPVGSHSNRKPLESRLILASDEDSRILFIRKSQKKKVHSNNLMAHKLLRFPIKSCKESLKMRTEPKRCEPVDGDEAPKDTLAGTSSMESLDSCIMNELPNSIYFELANQMVKDAIELSHSAEVKYKSIGLLQEPHCSFVVQVFSEIKWSRLSIIPREIFALYLPEPVTKSSIDCRYNNDHCANHSKGASRDPSLNVSIKMIINSIELFREIYYSECILPYKEYIWKLLNWESQLHSLSVLSILWYLLFHPKYIFSFGFLTGLIVLFINFDNRIHILSLESSISRKFTTFDSLECGDEFLEDNILLSPLKSRNYSIKSPPSNSNTIPFESFDDEKSSENIDLTALENLLMSSIISPNATKYVQKISIFLEKSAMLLYGIIKLYFWNNFFQTFILALVYLILLITSLAYSNELCKFMQYFFLMAILLLSAYLLPPIKGFIRIIKSYNKYKQLKRSR